MSFWILAVAILAIPAAIISWPMFGGPVRERVTGLLLLLIIPFTGLVVYQQVGNPVAIDPPAAVASQPNVEDLVADLQQRMQENPADAEGWVILGRSLKTMHRYVEASAALANANRLLPGTPLIMVELAEASLFASGEPTFTDEILQLLQDAVEIDPEQQKGLWLLGMGEAQNGNDEQAIALWQRLLVQVDPASGIGQSVTQQIEALRARSGLDSSGQSFTGFEIPVSVTLADELATPLPESAILFVFMHPAGEKGMPLAVKRIPAPHFPISLNFSNDDLLRPGTSLENYAALDISARVSMTGVANSASGDYQANAVEFDTNVVREIALYIAQRVP